ncbi:hypothetical protein Ciccas_008481 [Cichlidogyrus casuarinus]|uniref:Uncharacterized protein n=1 Tax=Cichlidogyrus casuarinus TaxID=1844966 RepID=A0ABD2Q420_9PLAT
MDGYIVVATAPNGAKQWIHVNSKQRNATFTNLALCGTYRIFVYARSSEFLMSQVSGTIVVETDFKLPKPSSIFPHQNGSSSLQLYINGQDPNCPAFFLAQLLTDSSVVPTISSSDRKIIFANLKRETVYTARVSVISIGPTVITS